MSTITYHDNSTATHTYDAGDRLTQVVDSTAGTIMRSWDLLDRLTGETTPEGSISYTYDAADPRATMTAGVQQATYSYDDADRLTGITQWGSSVGFTYDSADRRATLTLPNGMEFVASEMVRVCRPGGRIIMGNWTPQGHVGQMFKVIGQHVPPPANVPSPLLWGDEATCRQRFGTGVNNLTSTRYLYPFEYPFAPARVVDFFIEYYGPTNRAYASLTDEGRKALHDDLTALWSRNNLATDGTTRVQAEYIEVVGTRA